MYTVQDHIEKSYARLLEPEYRIEHLFRPADYTWYGDWEGRALLAFCNQYAMTGRSIPAMEQFVSALPAHLNAEGFLGPVFDPAAVREQQLSGHGWLLCGLMEHYALFARPEVLRMAERIFENLFYRALPHYDSYPVEGRSSEGGDVSGSVAGNAGAWQLSTDIGCAFICLDGVSRYYAATHSPRAEEFLRRTVAIFMTIDKCAAKMQTHATLTAARGILRFYTVTGEREYLAAAEELFALYVAHGMTYTYENYNWFGRPDTWTEPCAVVDSFLLATALYHETGDGHYRTLARRIWFNGLSFSHRANGGAGTNRCVRPENPYLFMRTYEAPFCCTMRYNEGLVCALQNADMLTVAADEPRTTDALGRCFVGDRLVVVGEEDGEEHLLPDLAFPAQGCPRYRVFAAR